MGLDMYLSRKRYIGANYEHRNVQGKIELTEGEDNTPINVNLKKVRFIEEEAGYWRKANAIHNWFVQNVQNGIDECQQSYVSVEKLKELLETCKKVKDSLISSPTKSIQIETGKVLVFANTELAEELLPTQGGFFFGSTDYDMWYLGDIEHTIEVLENALKDSEGCDFYYQASW